MILHHHLKKCVPVMTLLLTVAIAVPSWSAEDENANQAVSESTPSEPAAPAINQETASPETTSTPSAQQPEQAVESLGDSGTVETLPPSYNPLNWLIYKPLWALNGLIGNFNPIGNYVADPLEAAIPGLRFKGFLNTITQINTTATNHNVGFGGRDKDWRLQKQEFRLQTEFKYQANENIEFVNVDNMQYDGAYDFQSSNGLYRDGSSNQVYYSQGKRIIRELYARGNYGKFNFTLGKQIVNWGKMDGKVIDIVNAQDWRDVVDSHIGDYEWRAIGQWMAYASIRPVENTTVSLLINPDFQPNTFPAFGSPYWFPWAPSPPAGTPHASDNKPSGVNRFKDEEVGLRADTTIGALSFSGLYYYGFDRDPVTFSSDGANHYTRLNRYGYAADYATSIFGQRLIIRSEGLYTAGMAFNTSDPTARNGIVKKDVVKIALAFETSIFSDENKIDVLYQPIYTTQLGFDPRTIGKLTTPAARSDIMHVINLSHSFRATNDKLSLSTTGYLTAGSDFGGFSYNVSAGWRFNDNLRANVAFNDYNGGENRIPWGAYEKWKNVTIDLKYEW
jgi:hypothetical protein